MAAPSPNPLERAMSDKRPVPEVDFTLHVLEDNTMVSTQDRVCKGQSPSSQHSFALANPCTSRGASSRLPSAHPRSISIPP